jgi:hypothetical protein
MSIQSSAVLVKLSISTWAAFKKDKTQTENVALATGADTRAAGRYTKNLMAGTKHVKELNDYAARCRLDYNLTTMPWDDRGDRVLPTSLVLDFKTRFNEKRDEFFRGRDYIITHYAQLKQIAANYLGAMYDPSDYPSEDEVYAKYNWQLSMKPIPDSGHLYLDLPKQDMDELREALDRENEEKLKQAMQAPWTRLHDILTGMSAKLTSTGDMEADDKKRFHGTFLTNAQELVDLLGHMNISGDPKLEDARNLLAATIRGQNIEVIKASQEVRDSMKHKVDRILEQFDW